MPLFKRKQIIETVTFVIQDGGVEIRGETINRKLLGNYPEWVKKELRELGYID